MEGSTVKSSTVESSAVKNSTVESSTVRSNTVVEMLCPPEERSSDAAPLSAWSRWSLMGLEKPVSWRRGAVTRAPRSAWSRWSLMGLEEPVSLVSC